MSATTQERIRNLVNSHDVYLFMKGNPAQPQCGFSAAVVSALAGLGVQYGSTDVLQDPFIREGVKEFAKWPTLPQLYIKGQFVGGCDIVTEMAKSGELKQLLAEHDVALQAS